MDHGASTASRQPPPSPAPAISAHFRWGCLGTARGRSTGYRSAYPCHGVDAKKRELVGNFAPGGAEWMPAGKPERVNVHDFVDKELGKATPYGVYDVTANTGWGQCRDRRRHRGVRGGVDPPLVGHRRADRLPGPGSATDPVSYTHLRAHETRHDLVCRLL